MIKSDKVIKIVSLQILFDELFLILFICLLI